MKVISGSDATFSGTRILATPCWTGSPGCVTEGSRHSRMTPRRSKSECTSGVRQLG